MNGDSHSRFKVARVDFVEPIAEQIAESNDAAIHPAKEYAARLSGDAKHVRRNSSTASDSFHRIRQQSTCSSTPPHSPLPGDPASSLSYSDTHHLKTFGHNTLETLPHADHYRNLLSATGAMRKRPTLHQLHENNDLPQESYGDAGFACEDVSNGAVAQALVDEHNKSNTKPDAAVKFGWIQGVLVRCLLNIWGVMLFLRLQWIVAHAGIGFGLLIIMLSSVVTTITALSMSAICTNGQVKGGGAYYMISRSLGPEFGGAIGLIFSVANAVAVALYVVGFAETIRDILKEEGRMMVDEVNDVRIMGLITVIVLLAIALVGMEWEAKVQIVLLIILLIAITNFTVGTFLAPSETDIAKGFVGYQGWLLKKNFYPDYRSDRGGTQQTFFSVFSVFFPAATGILAGANISGDLKDAQYAIPRGTLIAILISTIVYVSMAVMAGACLLRDAPGPDALNASLIGNISAMLQFCSSNPCSFGMHNSNKSIELASGFGPLIIVGIVAATLSSALASLMSAPKVFQAVCKDEIFPKIQYFAKGYGKAEEPRRAYILAFVLALAFTCIGELNAIAPLISNFFLMSYALINYSCFDASLAKSPGWRPAFGYYSMWLSLVGALLCMVIMFVINWWAALFTLLIVTALYVYVHHRKPDINWGSSTQAHVYKNALQSALKLVAVVDHVKNYRPQILVLTGFPADRRALVHLAYAITRSLSLMVCGHVTQLDTEEGLRSGKIQGKKAISWLQEQKVKAFYNSVSAESLRLGTQALFQCVGIGKLRPNLVLMGFKHDWKLAKPSAVYEYTNIVHDAFNSEFGVGVLRLREGLDLTSFFLGTREGTPDEDAYQLDEKNVLSKDGNSMHAAKEPSGSQVSIQMNDLADESQLKVNVRSINQQKLKQLNFFTRKQTAGTIDVWWLFDDGGLTLLIPYILSQKSQWKNCKLRVFSAGTKKGDLDRDQRHMATLLSKFRIAYSSITVLPDIGKKPSEESRRWFGELISPWQSSSDPASLPWMTSESELESQNDKTYRHLRLRELLKIHSSEASLIVMTLPMPKRGCCSAGLYMSWLETLTADMPPILLLRGNQESVLTYYS